MHNAARRAGFIGFVISNAALGCAPPPPPSTARASTPGPKTEATVTAAPVVVAPPPTPPAMTASAWVPPTPPEASPLGEPGAAPASRPWLGVELEPSKSGVRVARVVPKSPAEQAGMQANDEIVRLDDTPVTSPPEVVAIVSERAPGTRIAVALKRGGADRLLPVTLGTMPDREAIYRMSFIDRPAPAFQDLIPANGTFTPTLKAERGHVVVVEFWASWCVACRALIPHMNRLQEQYGGKDVRLIAITNDPVADAATAAKGLGMNYPVASDESGKTAMAYEARAIPCVFLIDRAGTVRDVMVGYDPSHLPKLDAMIAELSQQH